MKHSKLYISAMLFAALAATSCDDNWDTPPMVAPVATIEANTSIEELKTKYWQEANNCVDTIGYKDDGKTHYIIKGRVVSSDESGNIYKNLVIQDTYSKAGETPSCITFSINANSLYASYRPGQEVVIDATDMYIGKYSGLQQFGLPEYSSSFGWQTTFMPLEFFKKHAQLNGFPEPEKIDTLRVPSISSLPTDAAGIRKYQSQLVRFDGVKFVNGGKETFASYQTTVSQNLTDGNSTIAVRTSGYSNFYYETLPEGEISVVGILGYFNNSWQLTLRSLSDCIYEEQIGTQNNPVDVAKAISLGNENYTRALWVKGYIVGAVAPGVSEVKSNADIEWTKATLPNTLVIADNASERDYKKCVVIDLPQGSALRTKANLADNPDNFGAPITLHGTIGKQYGITAITGNSGAANEFVFVSTAAVNLIDQNFESYNPGTDGYVDLADSNLLGDGWTSVTASGNKNWSMRAFSGNVYATFSGYKGKAPFDAWLITPLVDFDKMATKVMSFDTQVNGYGSTKSKFEVYVMTSNNPAEAKLTKLDCNIATAPASGYSSWEKSGDVDLSKFSGKLYIGFRYTAGTDANYATWCFDNLLVGKRSGAADSGNDGSETKPYTASDVLGGITGTDKWVSGYIVGFSSSIDANTSAKFTAEGANNLNVLIADKASEKAIISEIRRAYPEHSVLSEEAGCDKRMNDWLWVIDPLDGTTNYSSGLPNFCVSIGVQHKGQTVVGVVYAPYLGEIFTAVRGKGAFLNNRPIRCSTKTDIHKAVVSTGFPVDKDRTTDCNVDNLVRVLPYVRGMRRLGAAAIDICYVAAGLLDGYWEMNLHEWDVCAALLIAEEAGAVHKFFRTDRNVSVVVAAPGIMPSLEPLISEKPFDGDFKTFQM